LLDSGAQYLDGTTDITRTILLGTRPTTEQRRIYTLVLKGHIELARALFPRGVRGMRLDTLARMHLWTDGRDYNHGTGHGVGSYLSVHEGPQSISPLRCKGAALEKGNILSNEPGYYATGKYGIRIENLVLVVQDDKLSQQDRPWFAFETLTLCPIDTSLLDVSLLTSQERQWLNDYHKRVAKTLMPLLGDAGDRRWLKSACKAV
jgi:Xaa-Pro aminopeptidase